MTRLIRLETREFSTKTQYERLLAGIRAPDLVDGGGQLLRLPQSYRLIPLRPLETQGYGYQRADNALIDRSQPYPCRYQA
jgi:hypothetical protein